MRPCLQAHRSIHATLKPGDGAWERDYVYWSSSEILCVVTTIIINSHSPYHTVPMSIESIKHYL